MAGFVSFDRWFRRASIAGALACGAAPMAHAATDPNTWAGVWTLALDQKSRLCRVELRTDSSGNGWGLSMPPGCRLAFPALKTVQSWSLPSEHQVSFDDAGGAGVMTFDDLGTHVLQATDVDGRHLTMTALNRQISPAIVTTLSKDDAASGSVTTLRTAATQQTEASPAPTKASPVAAQDVAGQYAVLRGDKDTGCMVTLDKPPRGGAARAHLAPACRDQGIIIFDPLGWQMTNGSLVLKARKGHTISLDRDENGVWVKDPQQGKTIGLKRL